LGVTADVHAQSDTRAKVRRQAHAKLDAALELLRTAPLEHACGRPPPPLLRRGIAEFNRGQFFEQHETLEALWRAEPDPIRFLYQGILQLGVGFYHLERGNFHGAVIKLENGLALLESFEPACMRVDVARLRRESARCLARLLVLGPERLEEFERAAIPTVHLKRGRRR
jgi:predicted metal-dependent hydrolase